MAYEPKKYSNDDLIAFRTKEYLDIYKSVYGVYEGTGNLPKEEANKEVDKIMAEARKRAIKDVYAGNSGILIEGELNQTSSDKAKELLATQSPF